MTATAPSNHGSHGNLEERDAICQLKYRYARSVDLRDFAAIETMLTDDFTWVFNPREAPERTEVRSRAENFRIMRELFPAAVIAQHHMHHPEITLTGPTTAEGIWYLEYFSANVKTRQSARGTAIYYDQYVKIAAEWKIRQSRYRVVYRIEEPLAVDAKVVIHYASTLI